MVDVAAVFNVNKQVMTNLAEIAYCDDEDAKASVMEAILSAGDRQ